MSELSGKERIDTVTYSYSGCAPNHLTESSTQEYFIRHGSSITHYTYNVYTQACSVSALNGSLPNTRIPDGYNVYTQTAAATTYYFRQDGHYPFATGITDMITVSKHTPVVPLTESYVDNEARSNLSRNTTWTSFKSEEPMATMFNLPSSCI